MLAGACFVEGISIRAVTFSRFSMRKLGFCIKLSNFCLSRIAQTARPRKNAQPATVTLSELGSPEQGFKSF